MNLNRDSYTAETGMLDCWREDVKAKGAKVRKTSGPRKTDGNIYYQAILEGVIIGYFNTCFGGELNRTAA